MASESLATDQSLHELADEKKVGDDTKEEEKHDPEDVSVADGTKNEEHEQTREINNSLQKSEVSNPSEPSVGTSEGKPNDVIEISASKEPLNSELKQEDLEDAEVTPTSENETKSEKAYPTSTFEVETQGSANPDSSMDKGDTEMLKSEDTEDEVQELVLPEVPTIVVLDTNDRSEVNDVDTSTFNRINVPVKDQEVESSSSDEQKLEENAETKADVELVKSKDAKNEIQELVPTKIPSDTSEAPDKNNVDLITPTSIDVSVKDLDGDIGSHEETKHEDGAEEKDVVELITPTSGEATVKDTDVDFVSPEEKKLEVGTKEQDDVDSIASTSAEEAVKDPDVNLGFHGEKGQEIGAEEKNGVDSIAPTNIEVTVKVTNFDLGSIEEKKQAVSAEIKEHAELVESKDLKEEVQELAPAKVSINASETPEKSDVDSSALTTIEVPVKDLEVEFGYPEEQKSEESAETKVDIKLAKSEYSKDELKELVTAEISPNTLGAPEKDIDSSKYTSTEVPVKDLEVETGSPEEEKPEQSAETKEPISTATTIDGGVEVAEVVGSCPYEEKPSGVVESVEKNDEGSQKEVLQTTSKLPEDLKAISEIDQTQPYEDKVSQGVEVEEWIVKGCLETSTILDIVPPVAKISSEDGKVSDTGEIVQEKDETFKDDGINTVHNVPEFLLEGIVLGEENSVDKVKEVDAEAIDRGLAETSVDPIVAEVSSEQVHAPENVEELLKVGSGELDVFQESSEVPFAGERVFVSESLKGEDSSLKVQSGSSEEQKQEKSADIKELSSNATTIDGGGEAPYEEKSSGVAEVVEGKDEGFKEGVIQTTAKWPENLKPRSEVDQTLHDEDKISEGVAVKEDWIVEGGTETSTLLDVVPPLAKVSSEVEKVSDSGEVFQQRKEETAEDNGIDTLPKVSEVSLEGDVFEKDNYVGKEKDVNVEAIDRDLAETSIDSIVAEVSNGQVQAPENVEEPLKLTSTELKVSPEYSEVPSVGEKVLSGDKESESLEGKGSTSAETSRDITTLDESLQQADERKNDSSKNETDASVELSPDAVKDIIASETYKNKKDETSTDFSLEEKNVNVPDDKEEAEAQETIEKVTDNTELEEFRAEKEQSEKSKDEFRISGDAKLVKETIKRESNIFSKVKRSIIKAKKAILGKSPGPKTVSSEAKN